MFHKLSDRVLQENLDDLTFVKHDNFVQNGMFHKTDISSVLAGLHFNSCFTAFRVGLQPEQGNFRAFPCVLLSSQQLSRTVELGISYLLGGWGW